jgi:glycosyltransferase involved in cell wall biosynthesis
MKSSMRDVSIVLPAHNEADTLRSLLPRLKELYPAAELVVVDDGSDDHTAAVCDANGVTVVSHPYAKGNGAAVKTGARTATGRILVFMDADGQHDPADVARLVQPMFEGYDMVVGARDAGSHASKARLFANVVYNRLAGWMVNRRIDDLTSGFRAVEAAHFKRFLYLLPNGFSYPTTITMSFFRAGFSVGYVPIKAARRLGVSHIRPISDGLKFVTIIFRIASLYSPLKIFTPVSASFVLAGVLYYLYTYLSIHRFTNMSVLLLLAGVVVFLIGLLSEQISALNYRDRDEQS